ncbi:MAG: OmpA family protein, partial [Bacteroidota bacterium]
LTATNRALNDSYQSLKARYEDLLGQSQDMLTNKGEEVTGLQQSLAARTAEVAAREAELRQLELDLQEREQAVARIESDYAPAGGGAPVAYGQVTTPGTSARTPLSATQNAALRLNTIQNDLNQLLAYLPATDYVVSSAGSNRLQVVLAERALTSDGFTVSPNGRQLLQRMASTLRNYPSAEYTVIGHADGANANALRAYEDSTDKAINVAQQLVTYGLDPGKIVAGGKGFYSPVGDSSTPAGQEANRRTDIFITIPE